MKTLISTAVLAAIFSSSCFAQTISVSFAGDNAGGTSLNLTAADVAGVVPVANWNADAQGAAGTVAGLLDSTGTATAAGVEWSGANNTWGGSGATTPDEMMVNGWLDDNGTGAAIAVTGIPYATYDLHVYGSSDDGNAGRGMNVNVNGTGYYSGGVFTNLSAGGSFFSSDVGFVNGATTDADPSYIVVSGLSGDLSLLGLRDADGPALADGSTDYRGGISGFQITNAVPEPASFSMFAFAFFGLLSLRRRK